MTPYQKAILSDIEREVKVKSPKIIAEELGISESAVWELAPEAARKWNETKRRNN